MENKASFEGMEPEITKDEILVVKDKYFKTNNVAIVTGASSRYWKGHSHCLGR